MLKLDSEVKKITFRKSFCVMVAIWVFMIVASRLFDNGLIAAVTIAYSGMLPFLLCVFWISLSNTGVVLRGHLKTWHWTIIVSWLVFSYSLYARKWTASTLNEIFHVDPEKFSITYDFLAFFYAPVSILYQDTFTGGLLNILIALATGLVPLIGFALIADIKFTKIAKWSALLFGCTCLISFFLTTAGNISKHVIDVAINFALWADFNEKNMCTDEWAREAKGVVFLDGEKVLAYIPNKKIGEKFEIKICDLKGVI